MKIGLLPLLALLYPVLDLNSTTERNAKSPEQEDLRIDFGIDAHYLPRPGVPGAARMIESNIKSVLRLVHELDSSLPVSKRLLETESGYNFAERLEQALSSSASVQ